MGGFLLLYPHFYSSNLLVFPILSLQNSLQRVFWLSVKVSCQNKYAQNCQLVSVLGNILFGKHIFLEMKPQPNLKWIPFWNRLRTTSWKHSTAKKDSWQIKNKKTSTFTVWETYCLDFMFCLDWKKTKKLSQMRPVDHSEKTGLLRMNVDKESKFQESRFEKWYCDDYGQTGVLVI